MGMTYIQVITQTFTPLKLTFKSCDHPLSIAITYGPGLGKVPLVLFSSSALWLVGFLLGIVIPISDTQQVCVHKDGFLNATHLTQYTKKQVS